MNDIIKMVKAICWVLFILWVGSFLWNTLVFFTPLRLYFKPRWPDSVWALGQGVFFIIGVMPILGLFVEGNDDFFKVNLCLLLTMPILCGVLMVKLERLLVSHGI